MEKKGMNGLVTRTVVSHEEILRKDSESKQESVLPAYLPNKLFLIQ